jgi:hypothetical protein
MKKVVLSNGGAAIRLHLFYNAAESLKLRGYLCFYDFCGNVTGSFLFFK